MPVATNADVERMGKYLRDVSKPLKQRFRFLFTLKNICTDICVDEIAKSFSDSSALLKHELAYCLGQMQNTRAIPCLVKVLEDDNEDTIVRHESAEALGAIGSSEVLPVLNKYLKHPISAISETCELAIDRIHWLKEQQNSETLGVNPYYSVDPAPAMKDDNVENLKNILLDENQKLFERYRAMFTLRNRGSKEDILALCDGLKCSSALFRHEIAFVLGQVSHPAAITALKETLMNKEENEMVRHECAEALGGIATDQCFDILKSYSNDDKQVVRESCDIALDMCDYENSAQFQYADGLTK